MHVVLYIDSSLSRVPNPCFAGFADCVFSVAGMLVFLLAFVRVLRSALFVCLVLLDLCFDCRFVLAS